ncbi:universal stress protein [Sphingopyxis fribergensis]|uniref:universal stress protein n=1 Tax=Sphingopyxis fribergensis TaxID=1515612 RepID=UPI00068B27F8|nr:universal stress protein [Sphingopyxis fribergensis]
MTILTADSDRHPDHFGPEPGVNLLEYLSRHGAHVDIANTSSGRVPIAEAILGEAAARKADLVIVGVYSRPRTTKILFGGVTRSLLSGAHLPLLISR